MNATKLKQKEIDTFGYSIKEMDRDKDLVRTIHGSFRIIENKRSETSNPPLCYGCFYRYRKGDGAPCATGQWCGGLYDIVVPIVLNEDGQNLKEKRNVESRKV